MSDNLGSVPGSGNELQPNNVQACKLLPLCPQFPWSEKQDALKRKKQNKIPKIFQQSSSDDGTT